MEDWLKCQISPSIISSKPNQIHLSKQHG